VISRLRCQNFRSLEDLDIPLGPLTAIVGPNGAGKTTILHALDLVLGNAWPSLGRIAIPQDFSRFDATREMMVEAFFDPPLVTDRDALGNTADIHSFSVRCAPYKRRVKRAEVGDLHLDFDPRDSKGDVPRVAVTAAKGSGVTWRILNIGTALRDQSRLLMIDHRRSIVAHLPTARGSVLARLLEPARRDFEKATASSGRPLKDEFREAYAAAMDALRTPRLKEVEGTIAETARRTLGFMGVKAPAMEVALGIADPANPFHALRIICREDGLDIPAEEQGLGVQSAIVIGIFEALRRIGGIFGTVVIEEPEMYLHPQAQRYFYRLLRDLARDGEAQVIFSTHSPVFADPVEFEAIRLVRRAPGGASGVTWVGDAADRDYLADRRDRLKILTNFDTTRSEALFAARVLLVEGPADQVAARHVAEAGGTDVDGENLAIVACGGKSGIPFFARFLRALKVPFAVLHDEDLYPETGAPPDVIAENASNRRINAEIANAVGDPASIFVVAPTLEEAVGVGRSAEDKPMRVLRQLKLIGAPAWPEALRKSVEALVGAPAAPPTS
jgi:putative ATP-dependent endonuclease of OLD family